MKKIKRYIRLVLIIALMMLSFWLCLYANAEPSDPFSEPVNLLVTTKYLILVTEQKQE